MGKRIRNAITRLALRAFGFTQLIEAMRTEYLFNLHRHADVILDLKEELEDLRERVQCKENEECVWH